MSVFKFTVLILDDLRPAFEGTKHALDIAFSSLFPEAKANAISFLPPLTREENLTYNEARGLVSDEHLINSIDLCMIDISWIPESESHNTSGLVLASSIEHHPHFLKVLYSGDRNPDLWKSVAFHMPSIQRHGSGFHQRVLQKLYDFFNVGADSVLSEVVSRAFDDYFRPRRRRFIHSAALPGELSRLCADPETDLTSTISLDIAGEVDVCTLADLFFEAPTGREESKAYVFFELKRCLGHESRFSMMRRFVHDELDAIYLLTHAGSFREPSARLSWPSRRNWGRNREILESRKVFNDFFLSSSRKYYESIRPNLDNHYSTAQAEIQILDRILDDFEQQIGGTVENEEAFRDGQKELERLQSQYRHRIRNIEETFLIPWLRDEVIGEELLRRLIVDPPQTLDPKAGMINIWGPIVSADELDGVRSNDSFIGTLLTILEPDSTSVRLLLPDRLQDWDRCWLVIEGRCRRERHHKYADGAFALGGGSLSDVFSGRGGSLQAILETLIPLYFSPLIVESNDGQAWHCIDLARPLKLDKGRVGFHPVDRHEFGDITLGRFHPLAASGIRFSLRLDAKAIGLAPPSSVAI